MRLAIITTHPIQYYAPVFKLLHERKRISVKVFYTWGEEALRKFDLGFGKAVTWDIPLLEDYPFEWVQNISSDKGSHHFKGIINPKLIQQIEEWQPDAVLVYGWAYHSHLKAIRCFKNKLPVFFRGDSTLLNELTGLKKLIKFLYLKWIYKHVDHAFYVGSNNKAYFKKYGLKEEKLSFAPHAIDNHRFTNSRKQEVIALRTSLNIDDNDTLVIYAGKFEPVKNVELLLTAFMAINKPKLHLLLIGNGINENNLKQRALAANIHFLDFKNQSYMPVLYQAADLFCLPSISETWGLAVNEAMACSKAVLVSDKVGCAIDLVKDGYNGAVFNAQSLSSLTVNLESLINKGKEGLMKMGLNSKKIIDDWTFQKQVSAIESAVIKNG